MCAIKQLYVFTNTLIKSSVCQCVPVCAMYSVTEFCRFFDMVKNAMYSVCASDFMPETCHIFLRSLGPNRSIPG